MAVNVDRLDVVECGSHSRVNTFDELLSRSNGGP